MVYRQASPLSSSNLSDIRVFVTRGDYEEKQEPQAACVRVPPECTTIEEFHKHIRKQLEIEKRDALKLFIGPAFIPPSESIRVLRDGDHVTLRFAEENQENKTTKKKKQVKQRKSDEPAAEQPSSKRQKRKCAAADQTKEHQQTDTSEGRATDDCIIRSVQETHDQLHVRDPAAGWKARQEALREKALRKDQQKKGKKKQTNDQAIALSTSKEKEQNKETEGKKKAKKSDSLSRKPPTTTQTITTSEHQDQQMAVQGTNATNGGKTEPSSLTTPNGKSTGMVNIDVKHTKGTHNKEGIDEPAVTYSHPRQLQELPKEGDVITYQEVKLHPTKQTPQVSRLYGGQVHTVEAGNNLIKLKGQHVDESSHDSVKLRPIRTSKLFEVSWDSVYTATLWQDPSKSLHPVATTTQQEVQPTAASSFTVPPSSAAAKSVHSSEYHGGSQIMNQANIVSTATANVQRQNPKRKSNDAARFGRRSMGISQLLLSLNRPQEVEHSLS